MTDHMAFLLLLGDLDQELIKQEEEFSAMIYSMPGMTCLHETLQFLRVRSAPIHDHVGLINDQDWVAITFLPVEKEDSATNAV